MCLARNLRTHEEEECDQQHHQEKIDDSDGPPSSMHPFFNTRNGWVHQVGEENCKQESDERAASNIEKSQRQRENQHGEQNTRRAYINQGHFLVPHYFCVVASHQNAH